MRHRLVLILLGLAAGVATLASGAGAHQAHESGALPKLIAGSYSGIKPTDIDFSGDGGDIVIRIHWRQWTHVSAVGHGSSDILSCIPNCAQGKATPVSTTVTLSNVRSGHFTKVVEVRAGQTLVAHYGRPSWPEGAQ
jgi:hypothetical protein